jgi:hypothetical protein
MEWDYRFNIQYILNSTTPADREVHVVLKGHTDEITYRVLESGQHFAVVGRSLSRKQGYSGKRE